MRHQSIRQVACGATHSVVLLDTGDVFTWGSCDHGSLGHGLLYDKVLQPKKVDALTDMDGTVIACGSFHTMVATLDGQLYAFGWGDYGQLGVGTRENHASPIKVERIAGKRVRTVACGYFHTMTVCIDYKPPPKYSKEKLKEMYDAEMRELKKQKKKNKDRASRGSRSARGTNTRAGNDDRRNKMRESQRSSRQARKSRAALRAGVSPKHSKASAKGEGCQRRWCRDSVDSVRVFLQVALTLSVRIAAQLSSSKTGSEPFSLPLGTCPR